MKISFVIPAYNEEVLIAECLRSILSEIERSGAAAEVIVINNASTDRTREVAAGFDGVRVIDQPKKGLSLARDTGYRASSGELIANIDADNTLPEGWITVVLGEFDRDPGLSALTGPCIYYDVPALYRIIVKLFYAFGYGWYRVTKFLFRNGTMFQGGNYVVRRSAMDRIGGYNVSINFYGEDVDLGYRLEKTESVLWTFRLPILSSGRRLLKEGILTMGFKYAINYVWTVTFRRPFSATSGAVRQTERGLKEID